MMNNSKPKICFITPRADKSNGAEESLFSLVRYLKLQGKAECKVIVFEPEGSLLDELDELGIEHEYISAEWWVWLPWDEKDRIKEKFKNIFDAALAVSDLASKWGADLIYTNTSVTNVGALAATLINKPHVWHVRESVKSHPSFEPALEFFDFARYIGSSSNEVIFISKFLEGEYKEYLRDTSHSVIYNDLNIPEQTLKTAPSEVIVDIVIPFYNDPHILECLKSIENHWSDSIGTVTVIDDQGSNRELAKQVESLVESLEGRFEYKQNKRNQGFVVTCNKGMQESSGDVILLNTDTTVTKNWVEKLKTIAYQEDKVATVTPLSNAASYYSVPDQHRREYDNQPDLGNQIVEVISPLEYTYSHSPHGYCVYIRRDALQEIGYFDAEKYGMGYGEESDFGMRAVRAGYKNLISCKTYIYHLEGQSFGREGKKEIQREKRKILVADYPEVEELEREFHRRDPLKDIRRVMPFFKKYPELLQVPIAIQIGSIEENKGQVDIIRALAELQDGTPELHIIFVGKVADDNYKRQLDELISKYKLTHRVHFFGYVREPWALIKLAEIVVVSSRSEGLGRVAMEGMYFAKPIISTQVGGLVELLNESNSFSYPPGNSKQLAVHLTRLLGDKQLRNRLGGQAKKDITMLLSKQNYAEDITGIIKELIGKQNSQLGLTSFLSPWFLGEVMDSSVLGFILDKGYRRVRYQLRPIRKRIRKAQKKYMFRTRVKRFLGLVR